MTQEKINIDYNDTQEIICEQCGNNRFVEVLFMRKISALLSPNGEASLLPIPTFECSKCGHVNKEFLPKLEQ